MSPSDAAIISGAFALSMGVIKLVEKGLTLFKGDRVPQWVIERERDALLRRLAANDSRIAEVLERQTEILERIEQRCGTCSSSSS